MNKSRFKIITSFCLLFIVSMNYAQTVEVQTIVDLRNAIEKANPGTDIILVDGTYENDNLLINAKGTEKKHVIIRAKNKGKVVFESPVEIKGDYISLIGIQFKEQGSVILEGKGCQLSRCTFSDSKAKKWVRVLPGSSNIEIDHNLFKNKTINASVEKGCQLVQVIVRNQNEQHHIHHNLFKDIPPGKVGNGYETLQLITENNPFNPPPGDCNTVIENNAFIRCNGEAEVISIKSNGNIVRKNTFRSCKGSMVFRHGDNNIATQNFFFGDGEPGSGGVRLQGTDQAVVNNYFYELGQFGIGMMDGTPDDLYIRVERAQILFNTFINCNKTMVIGLNHSLHPNGTPPKDCTIAGNIFYTEKHQSFFTFVQDDQPENWTWSDNVAFGGLKMTEKEGIQVINPKLDVQDNGMALPTKETPSSKFESELTKNDLFNKKRGNKLTAGAIKFPVKINSACYPTEETVGPYAK
ncbi:polysaccharide lyase 6 family protein [Draconibacterium sp.]|nr:polysaccharide lyase 6 family protein [Draconibacterium sp.]